jgi:hypothetical protein
LLEQIAALVGVAKQQAQLTQALNTSSETTLEYARKTGADTKASTDLARDTVRLTRWAIWIAVLSPILSALIGIGVSVYLDRRNSMANEERAKAEQSLRQQEIRILDAISQRLATQTPAPVVLPPKRVRQR